MTETRQNEEIEFAFEPSNYTQTPNKFFDEVMPEITSMAELKVTLAVLRKTFGWRDEMGPRVLSLTALQGLTGLSRQSCQEGATKACARGYIGRRRDPNSSGAFLYGVRVKKVGSVQATRPPAGLDTCTPPNKGKKEQKENSSVDDRIEKAFAYWLTILEAGGRNSKLYKLTKARKRALKARLADSASDEIRDAMLGAWGDRWCQETGQWDIAYCLRDRDLLEKYRDKQLGGVRSNGNGHAAPVSEHPEYNTTRPNPELQEA